MRTVREIMEPDVFWVPTDMPLGRAAEVLAEHQISGAPACSPDGRIVGILTMRDLTEFYGGSHELRLVRDVMTPEILSVGPDDSIDQAIRTMAFEGVHRLLVVDDEHRLLGIVTSMDILCELSGFTRPRAGVFPRAPRG